MKAFINWPIFSQTIIDSGRLTSLGVIVHNFSESGEYLGEVFQEGEITSSFYLTVDPNSTAIQAEIDLSALNKQTSVHCYLNNSRMKSHFIVNPKGYVSF